MGKGIKSIVGLGILGGAAFGGFKAFKEYEYLKETHNNVILFNGEKLVYDEVYEGDSVAAVMAGVEIDLREAEFEADYSNLDLYGVAAGFKVLVPADIKVVVSGVNKASGIDVNTDDSASGNVLNITYDMTASGLLVLAAGKEEEGSGDSEVEGTVEEAPETVIDKAEETTEETAEETAGE